MTIHTDPAAFIGAFFTDFTNAALVPEADPAVVVDRFHTFDMVEVTDGVTIDRKRLIAHLRPIRRNLESFSIEVHQVVADGIHIAALLTIDAVMRGRRVVTDIGFFGEFAADGRLRRARQVTRSVRDRAESAARPRSDG